MAKHFDGTDEMQYDVISGVSVGSINAGIFSLFPKGSELAATQFMFDCWMELSNKNVWSYWSEFKIVDIFEAIYEYKSLMNYDPLEKYLQKIFDEKDNKIHRKVLMGATDLLTGSIVVTDYEQIQKDDYVDAIIGSASVPVLFPAKEFRGQYLIDGGVSWNLNMVSAFKKCMELVDHDPSRIILDVIVMFKNDISILPDKHYNSIHNFIRKK